MDINFGFEILSVAGMVVDKKEESKEGDDIAAK